MRVQTALAWADSGAARTQSGATSVSRTEEVVSAAADLDDLAHWSARSQTRHLRRRRHHHRSVRFGAAESLGLRTETLRHHSLSWGSQTTPLRHRHCGAARSSAHVTAAARPTSSELPAPVSYTVRRSHTLDLALRALVRWVVVQERSAKEFCDHRDRERFHRRHLLHVRRQELPDLWWHRTHDSDEHMTKAWTWTTCSSVAQTQPAETYRAPCLSRSGAPFGASARS